MIAERRTCSKLHLRAIHLRVICNLQVEPQPSSFLSTSQQRSTRTAPTSRQHSGTLFHSANCSPQNVQQYTFGIQPDPPEECKVKWMNENERYPMCVYPFFGFLQDVSETMCCVWGGLCVLALVVVVLMHGWSNVIPFCENCRAPLLLN